MRLDEGDTRRERSRREPSRLVVDHPQGLARCGIVGRARDQVPVDVGDLVTQQLIVHLDRAERRERPQQLFARGVCAEDRIQAAKGIGELPTLAAPVAIAINRFIVSMSGPYPPDGSARGPLAPSAFAWIRSVNMAFSRQPLGRRRKLNFIRAALHDAVANGDTALDTYDVSVA